MKDVILLTGATGFLGSHLLKALLLKKFDVVALKRSTSRMDRIQESKDRVVFYDIDEVDLKSVFSGHNIKTIIHCATNYGRSQRKADEVVEANLMLPLRLLLLGIDAGISTFINTDTLLDKGVNEYSLSKKQFLDWLKVYSDLVFSVNVAIEHFYGPNDDPSKFTSFVIKSMLGGIDNIDLTLGKQKRDFIYIDDVVDAFMAIVELLDDRGAGFLEYELGSGELTSVEEFVKTVKTITGNSKTTLNFGVLPYRKNELMESSVDLSLLKKLGWSPKVKLVDGLNKTIEIERKQIA